MLEIRDLRKTFHQMTALDGLSMTVSDGAIYGFVGPNGAGKTNIWSFLHPAMGFTV